MGGKAPPLDWSEARILAWTGWTYADLDATPSDVVERVFMYKLVEHTIRTDGEMTFG